MLIRTHLEELPALGTPLHLALGVFDGMHVGHQAVLARVVAAAARDGGLAGVLTFDPHPIRVLAPASAPSTLLTTLEHKARIVSRLGIGLFVPLHFDETLARLEATEFLAQLLAAPIRTLAVGEDWCFGRDRRGDVGFLRAQATRSGFVLEAVPPVMIDGERVSSTRVRQAIRDGSLAAATRMLGRPYAISGSVLEGRKLGRQLGFPTANVAIGEVLTPPDGVWAVRVTLSDGSVLSGVANLGVRPTVDGATKLLEAHLCDFSGDLYGREIEVALVKLLRAEMKFPSLEALREQIGLDVLAARRCLAE
ncbi:MAG: riboflavin biosynthesis protein RibF [Verrucomicrobia bacterium]|nr:riboflavin biosynthesis protein RibF [Verrucomicrobiota bacterium]